MRLFCVAQKLLKQNLGNTLKSGDIRCVCAHVYVCVLKNFRAEGWPEPREETPWTCSHWTQRPDEECVFTCVCECVCVFVCGRDRWRSLKLGECLIDIFFFSFLLWSCWCKIKKKKRILHLHRPCLPTTLCSSFLSASCFFHVLLSLLQLIYAPISPVTGIPVKILKNTVRFSLIGFYWQHAVSPLTFTVGIFRLANISWSVL